MPSLDEACAALALMKCEICLTISIRQRIIQRGDFGLRAARIEGQHEGKRAQVISVLRPG
jgi:hypothetical protein